MKTVFVVGCTRSGLSLTMQMLQAGGYPCVGDFPAFEKYPIGKIPWKEIDGMAVKIVDTDRQFPPKDMNGYVIRLRRNLDEQAKSFNKFVTTIFNLPAIPLKKVKSSFRASYRRIDKRFRGYPILILDFEYLISEPMISSKRIAEFLGMNGWLDIEKMSGCAIDRCIECHVRFLEGDMINKRQQKNKNVQKK